MIICIYFSIVAMRVGRRVVVYRLNSVLICDTRFIHSLRSPGEQTIFHRISSKLRSASKITKTRTSRKSQM